MARGRSVDDDELVFALCHGLGESPKYGDLFCTRAPKVLFEQRFTLRVEPTAGGRQHFLRVAPRLEHWIDARDP